MTAVSIEKEILLIDDDPFQLKLISHQLGLAGFKKLTSYTSAHKALEVIGDRLLPNMVIILDLNMPQMDGLEFLEKLKDTPYSGALLLVSGEDERVLQATVKLAVAYSFQVLGHLSKPVRQEQLKKILESWNPGAREILRTSTQQTHSAERLRQALDQGELFNVYQPKVKLSSGELMGVEALVRWKHPQDGIIYPDRFISVAEENNLIDEIAQLVIKNAMHDINEWKAAGIRVPVAINISMYNLNTRAFISFLEKELIDANVSPQDLTLEITESKLMNDYALVLDILTRLRLRKFNLSIDDFGTGHSSMAQLRDIPFNELKIDQGFVHTAWDNATLHGIFDGSMQLAKNLGIKTVAEGVQDVEDWTFLGKTDCDLAQGFFIGRPMEASVLMAWRNDWAQRYAVLTGT
ncbi:MAG: EAL domain-containing response regulator [Pseudohongiellaceae bacterium]